MSVNPASAMYGMDTKPYFQMYGEEHGTSTEHEPLSRLGNC